MKKSLVLGAGRGPRLALLEAVKRSGNGMSVQELAALLGMSYMGVKSHCLALESTGHLTSRRATATKGRPRVLYSLSGPGELLFKDSGQDVALAVLKESANLFGATAPQKLLLQYFRSIREHYLERIDATDPVSRARQLARIRDREGRMAEFVEASCWELHESHNPLAVVMEEYPESRVMEEHLFREVIGIPLKRREEGGRIVFVPADKKF